MTERSIRLALVIGVLIAVPLLLAVDQYRFTFDNPSIGDTRAPYTLEYFSTADCPGCRAFETTDVQLLEPLIGSGELRLIFRDLPASESVAELARQVFCLQAYPNFAELRRAAKSNRDFDWANLPVLHGRAKAQHQQCVTDDAALPIHEHNQRDFEDRGFNGTPAFTLIFTDAGKAARTHWAGRPDTPSFLHAMDALRTRVTDRQTHRREK